MDWIDKINKDLEERRNHNKTPEAKEEAEQRRKTWAGTQGGITSINQLLSWQKDNDFSIGKVKKTNEHKKNIGTANKGKVRNEELRARLSDSVKNYNSNLNKEEKIEKYSNDSSSRKSLRIRQEILDNIPTDIFTTFDAKIACEKYGIGNWKGFLKDTRIIKQIHKGTNQSNPSIYEKVK